MNTLIKTIAYSLLLLTGLQQVKAQYRPATVIISGHLDTKRSVPDTLELQILQEFGHKATYQPEKVLKTVAKSGHFKFEIKSVSKPFYILIYTPGNYAPFSWDGHLLRNYLVEPGDSIHINFDEDSKRVSFSGQGALKYTWRYNLLKHAEKFNIMPPYPGYNAMAMFPLCKINTSFNLASLDSIRTQIHSNTYQLLKADALYWVSAVYDNLAFFKLQSNAKDSWVKNSTILAYEELYLNYPIDTSQQLLKSYSATYAMLMMNKAKARFAYNQIKSLPNPPDEYSLIKQSYAKGILRDKVITAYLFELLAQKGIVQAMLEDAVKEVEYAPYRGKIRDLLKAYGAGQQVTDFNFVDPKGQEVTLKNFKDQVVLVDLWFTGCSGCIDVARGLPTVEHAFKDNPDVAFVSLCVDQNKNSWLQSIDPLRKTHTSYTHFTTSGTKYLHTGNGSQHPFIKKYNPTGSYPKLLLIKNGKIYSSSPPIPTDKRRQELLISALKTALKS